MPPRKRTAKGRAAKPKRRSAAAPRAAARRAPGRATGRATGGASRGAARRAPFPLPEGWRLERGGKSIALELETKDFLEALLVINECAQIAEDQEHHPDFHLERWNHLRIVTYSHDVGRLTERDQGLAERISEALAKRGLSPA